MRPLAGTVDGRRLTPFNIALLYVLVGGAWITASDRLVGAMVDDAMLLSQIQTGKGWLFVGVSAGLVYALVSHRERRLVEINDRLEWAARQTTVLHRILRHNLRNVCNVIDGNADLLDDELDGREAEYVCAIQQGAAELLVISEKTKHLRSVLSEDAETRAVDVVPVVRRVADEARARYPGAKIQTDLPSSARAMVVGHLELALTELAENAVEHNDVGEPSLRFSVVRRPGGTVRIDVEDDGPGVPETELEVLERGYERPTLHSEGLGLWLVYTIVTRAGGSLGIVDDDPRGSIVRLTFEAAEGT